MLFKLICIILFPMLMTGHDIYLSITVEPTKISFGETAILKWKVKNVDHAYIFNIGGVTSSGEKRIRPDASTRYEIIVKGDLRLLSKGVFLEVMNGSKGNGPNIKEYKHPFRYNISNQNHSYIEILNIIHEVLQNKMKFSVIEFEDPLSKTYIFKTNVSEKDYLVKPNEKRIGARRITYLVRIERWQPTSKTISYTIESFIQFRMRIEDTWRVELDDSIYYETARRFDNEIKNFLNQ